MQTSFNHLDVETVGWCMNENKMDQNEGSRVLGRFQKTKCLRNCQNMAKSSISYGIKITGCEHNQYNHVCQMHTEAVSSGSGVNGYTCWVFKSGK